MDGNVTEDAGADESNDCERQYVIADEERDKDVSCRCHGDREAGVPQCWMRTIASDVIRDRPPKPKPRPNSRERDP